MVTDGNTIRITKNKFIVKSLSMRGVNEKWKMGRDKNVQKKG